MLKVGEYGRTNLGHIIIFAWIENGNGKRYDNKVILIENEHVTDYFYYFKIDERIIKHSRNIIEIIEAADYVNGEKVLYTYKPDNTGEIPYVLTIKGRIYEDDIKTILTKEMYENKCYKVGV